MATIHKHLSINYEEDPTPTPFDHTTNIRNNPNRRRIDSICEKCRKAFFSEESFLQHSTVCNFTRENSDNDNDEECHPIDISRPSTSTDQSTQYYNKNKRPRRDEKTSSYIISSEEAAHCLVMLSSSPAEPFLFMGNTEERLVSPMPKPKPQAPSRGPSECKDCKKTFSCHQALGGHRASHKKTKGCFAAHLEAEAAAMENNASIEFKNNNNAESMAPLATAPLSERPAVPSPKKKSSKTFQCKFCLKTFDSGQALGGHKRCHYIQSNSPATTAAGPANLDIRPVNDTAQRGCSNTLMFNGLNHGIVNVNQLTRVQMNDVIGIPFIDYRTMMYLQQVDGVENRNVLDSGSSELNNDNEEEIRLINERNLEDYDAESNKELNLGELWDLNVGGDKSTWLQVGSGYMDDGNQSREDQS